MSIVHVAFYPSDWLAGTRGLSAEETGVYITLIARIYEMAGPIPRDDNRLSRLCGCASKSKFSKALEYLMSEGKIIERDGYITNERAEKEIKNVTEKSEKAKAAAQSRWDKKGNKNNGGKNANASPEHMLQGCHSEPEPDIEKEEPKGSKKKPEKKPDHVQVKENLSAVIGEDLAQAVFDHRKKISKPMTPRAATMLASKFSQYPDPTAAVEAMISNGWQGFEPEWLERTQATSKNGASSMASAAIANHQARQESSPASFSDIPNPFLPRQEELYK
jgi:uncharacterized protein YdaU (DUF1376 family)